VTPQQTKFAAIAAAVVVAAVAAFVLIAGRSGGGLGLPGIGKPSTCQLTGLKPHNSKMLDKAALAVKVENNPDAYPLSGLEKADIVNEELVEGGITRFMGIFGCSDATLVGPIRSTREIDPAIMEPITKNLAGAGGNAQVRKILNKYDVNLIDEAAAGSAMFRKSRPGYSSEHTLYGNTVKLRKIGEKKFSDAPPDDVFKFGSAPSVKAKKASSISINFSQVETIRYTYSHGHYLRSDYDQPLKMENGTQIAPSNVLIEEHTYNLSNITDVAGTHSTHIADPTGKGKAVLFRDGKAYQGTWSRDSIDGVTSLNLSNGGDMVLHPGQTIIELVPNGKGELNGSFSFGG
jgi:hypothetical protein